MATNDRTTNLSLPKVHPDNNMRLEDVPRLREFADSVDAALAARPTAATVASEIGAAVAPKADADEMTTALAGKVPTSRTLTAGTGLSGGGAFSSDVTLSLSSGTIASLALADSSVQPSRQVFAGTGLTGGGALSGNITLALSAGTIASLALADSALQPADRPYASDAQAEAGDSLTAVMNPDKTRHMLDNRPPGVPNRWLSTGGGNRNVAATDNGWMLVTAAGGPTSITWVDNLPFATTVSIWNYSGSPISVIQASGTTLEQVGTGNTGTFTLASKGFCTISAINNSGFAVVNGTGIS